MNKQNSTDQSIKTGLIGSVVESLTTGVIEGVSWKIPKLNGIAKMITNTIASDKASDKVKEKYQQEFKEKE